MYKTGMLKRQIAPVCCIVVASNVRDANTALTNTEAAHATGGNCSTIKVIESISGKAWRRHYPGIDILNDPAFDGLIGGVVNITAGIRSTKGGEEGGEQEWGRILEDAGEAGRAEQARVRALAEGCGHMLTPDGLRYCTLHPVPSGLTVFRCMLLMKH